MNRMTPLVVLSLALAGAASNVLAQNAGGNGAQAAGAQADNLPRGPGMRAPAGNGQGGAARDAYGDALLGGPDSQRQTDDRLGNASPEGQEQSLMDEERMRAARPNADGNAAPGGAAKGKGLAQANGKPANRTGMTSTSPDAAAAALYGGNSGVGGTRAGNTAAGQPRDPYRMPW